MISPRERARLDQVIAAASEMIEDGSAMLDAGILPLPWDADDVDDDVDDPRRALERWRGGPS